MSFKFKSVMSKVGLILTDIEITEACDLEYCSYEVMYLEKYCWNICGKDMG